MNDSNKINGDGNYVCQSCSKNFNIDLIVPDDLWKQVCPKPYDGNGSGGLLCGSCIMAKLEAVTCEADCFYLTKSNNLSQWQIRKVIENAKHLLHLHSCEQEGLLSGKPTPEMWFEAVNSLSESLSRLNELKPEK